MSLGIVGLNEAINRLTQLPHRSEAGTSQGVATQDAEPALHPSQLARVGVDVGVTAQPVVPFGFVRVQIVEDHMNLPSRMSADDLVHEIEKLAPTSSRIVARPNLP